MPATYDIELTASHYATALLRFQRQRPDYWRRRLMPFAALLPAVGAALFAAATESAWEIPAIVFAVAGVLLALTLVVFQRRVIQSNLQRTPTFGERIQIILDDRGARSVARQGSSELDWAKFTHVTRFADGFVLSQGGLDSWLPDSALGGASVAEVEQLLKSKINRFSKR